MSAAGGFNRGCAVYTITHKASGKMYVGISTNVVRRWIQHRFVARRAPKKHLHCALAKYGHEQFEWRVEAEFADRAVACECEKAIIAAGLCTYNHSSGGEIGVVPDLQTRTKIGAKSRGRKHTVKARQQNAQAQKARFKRSGHPRSGGTVSEEARERITEKLKVHYAQPGAKAHLFAQVVSAETRQKMSEAAKRRFARDGHPRQGVAHSAETKQKIRESLVQRGV